MLHALDQLSVFPLSIDLALATFGAAVCLFWLVVFTYAPATRFWTWLVRHLRPALAEGRTLRSRDAALPEAASSSRREGDLL